MGLLGLGRSGAQRRLLARCGRNGVRGQGTSRGLRPFLSSRRHQAGLTTILQPVTLAANVDGRRVMQQPIQNYCGDDRIAEDRSPVPIALVRGQDDAPPYGVGSGLPHQGVGKIQPELWGFLQRR